MRKTTKGWYAVTAMLDLALHHDAGPVALDEIARRQGISLPYLERILAKLRRSKLVTRTRESGGGYSLARGTESISVADIFHAVDEAISVGDNKDDWRRDMADRSLTSEVWANLAAKALEFLGSIALEKLVNDHRARGIPISPAGDCAQCLARPVGQPIRIRAPNSVFALGDKFST